MNWKKTLPVSEFLAFFWQSFGAPEPGSVVKGD